jgi:diadenosine tetraphosphate (Ap4A) HIT family hydrolase
VTNVTARKFGYPATLVAQGQHWAVLTRPAQPTLGALALVCLDEVFAFGDLSAAAHAELRTMTAGVERLLKDSIGYQKINYLMFMMVDPHVHFHVIPRYEGERSFDGLTIRDAGWPGMPDLSTHVAPDAETLARLTAELKSRWRA